MSTPAAFSELRDNLVVTLLGDLEAAAWSEVQTETLARVAARRARGVVVDVSAVSILDPHDIEALTKTLKGCQLLGARGVVVGLSAAIVAALVELDAPLSDLTAALNLEAGLDLLERELGRGA